MKALATILNKKACGSSIGVNTGKKGCLSLFGTPTHLILTKKGYKIPAGQELTLEFISENVQKGIFIPLIDSSNFEDLSAEDTYSTNTSGIKRLNLQGLIELKFMFEEGHEFYRELDKLQSYKSYDLIIIDDEDNWMLVENTDGTTGGFSLGHVTPEKRSLKVKGGDAEMKSLVVQLTVRSQWDSNYGIAHAEEIKIPSNEIPSVNGVILDMEVPTDADTTLNVTAKLSSDNNTAVTGLTKDNFLVDVDGSSVSVSDAVEVADGEYVLTITAVTANNIVSVSFWDGALNSDVIKDVGGVLYRAETDSETVLA